MPSLIFICTHNSARSQMAEGLMRQDHGDNFEAFSAGTAPGLVNPFAVSALKKINIDISEQRSKSIEDFQDKSMDYVITLCDEAEKNCPYLPARIEKLHHSFPDPSITKGSDAAIFAAFCEVRDQIRHWLNEFVDQYHK